MVVTARWHYDKHFTPTPTAVPSTFLGGKTKVGVSACHEHPGDRRSFFFLVRSVGVDAYRDPGDDKCFTCSALSLGVYYC